jgi:hypothetical protein
MQCKSQIVLQFKTRPLIFQPFFALQKLVDAGEKMKQKTIPMIRLTEEEYQLLQTKKMMLQTKSITATVKKCLFEADYLRDFTNSLMEINQRVIRVQRQNYITLKLCEGMLTEMSKLGRFPEKVQEINQKIIDQYFEAAKKEAEELYK